LITRPYQPSTPLADAVNQTSSSFIFFAFITLAVLLAPLFEEIIFRGYFFFVVDRLKGKNFAFIVIGSIFAIMHFDQYWGDWMAIATVTILGFVLTWMRAWTGTSISSIVAHYTYNLSVTVVPMIILMLIYPNFHQYQFNYNNLDYFQKEALLIKTIEGHENFAPAYNDLAWLYAKEEKNLDEALALIDVALSFDSEQFAYIDTKSEVLYKMGRIKEAIEIGEGLVDKYPNDEYAKEQLEKFRVAEFRSLVGPQ